MLETIPRMEMSWHIVDLLAARVHTLTGKTIAILGLADQLDRGDFHDAPELVHALLTAGARVRATEPVATPHLATRLPEVVCVADAYAAAMGADAVLLLTEGDAYRSLDLDHLANAMWGRLLIDAPHVLDPTAVAEAGLLYDALDDLLIPTPRRQVPIEQESAIAAD